MARTRKKVIDLDTYSKLDAYTIAINEYYKSLRRAGFAVDLALAIISERSTYPDWLLPALPNKIDSIPYEDDEDE
jgi:hypothetical protein